MNNIQEAMECVETREDFVRFVMLLEAELERKPKDWGREQQSACIFGTGVCRREGWERNFLAILPGAGMSSGITGDDACVDRSSVAWPQIEPGANRRAQSKGWISDLPVFHKSGDAVVIRHTAIMSQKA